jgi:hypothetical protein
MYRAQLWQTLLLKLVSNVDLLVTTAFNSPKKDEVQAAALIQDLRPPRVELNIAKEPCMEGTREDVLAAITEWLNDQASPNVGWLNGFPGAGKSAVAMSLTRTLHSLGRLGSSCFFQQEDASRQTTSMVVRTIAADLTKYPSIRGHILAKLKQDDFDLNDTAGLFKHLIIEPLSTMAAGDITLYGYPVLIIDALNECGGLEGQTSKEQENFTNSLQGWLSLPSQFKLFITSRDESYIQKFMGKMPHKLWTLFTGDNTTPQSSADISRFFTKKFKVIAIKESLETSWPEPDVVSQLTQLAGGLFNWARTVEKFVQDGNPKRQLETICNGNVRGLDLLYKVILESKYGKEADVQVYRHFRNITGVIILAREALHRNTVAALLRLQRDDVEYICSRLKSVLVAGDYLHFSHQSFPDFLSHKDSQCPAKFHFSMQKQSQYLTTAMLQVMNSELKFNICSFPSSYLLNKQVKDLNSRISNCISSQLSYSCRFWTEHISSSEISVKVKKLVSVLLEDKFLFWLEVLSLLGSLNYAPNSLSNLTEVPKVSTRGEFKLDQININIVLIRWINLLKIWQKKESNL